MWANSLFWENNCCRNLFGNYWKKLNILSIRDPQLLIGPDRGHALDVVVRARCRRRDDVRIVDGGRVTFFLVAPLSVNLQFLVIPCHFGCSLAGRLLGTGEKGNNARNG